MTNECPVVTQPTVWARALSQFVRRAESVGIARAELLTHAGVSEGQLADPDARVPLDALYATLEMMSDASGDPLAHMRVINDFDLAALDALAFVVMTSATLGAGIDAMLRHQHVFNDGERYDLEERGGWAKLWYRPWGPKRRAHALMSEMFAVDVLVNGAAMTGGAKFERARVLLPHAAPRARTEHRALLGGVAAEFGKPRCEVWLRRKDLARPIAAPGQEAVCAFFERRLEERVRVLPARTIGGRTRDLLLREPELAGDASAVAKRLRLSVRTLQRRLAEEQTSVRVLADEVRRARALPLLESGHSIAEIAYVLGYSEASVFHRAFRRWTGTTPETYRARTRVAADNHTR
jgi:AraC-like DNA-binding protein